MATERLFEWTWSLRPSRVEEFDQMMISLDRHLASLSLEPNQRGLNAALVVSSTLGLSGTPILGGSVDRGEPFSPADILARVHEWYSETYGDKAKIDFSPGSVVMSMHGNLWEIKMPKVWGSVQIFINPDLTQEGNRLATKGSSRASHNALRSVQGMTQAYASKLTTADMNHTMDQFRQGFPAVVCLDDLNGHDLFEEARGDYRHSVDALLSGREFGKARWDAAQCAEKIFKGLLARDGHEFPTSGGKGHDIVHLGGLAKEKLGISLLTTDLSAVHCSPAVRYGEQKSTRDEALSSHAALVRILSALSAAKVHHTNLPN